MFYCLLHVLQTPKSNVSTILPMKLTDIYINMFYFKHYMGNMVKLTSVGEPFENLPDGMKEDFKRLGEIPFIGQELKRG